MSIISAASRAIRRDIEPVSRVLDGTAVVYDVPQLVRDQRGEFYEVIKPGAFRNLDADNILFCASHDESRLLGRTGSRTLSLTDSNTRLDYRAILPNTTLGRETHELSRREDYPGVSIRFRVPAGGDRWSETNGKPLRTISSLDLQHIAVVSRPAYQSTSVAARSAESLSCEDRTYDR